MDVCPVCDSKAKIIEDAYSDKLIVNCLRCGQFEIAQTTTFELPKDDNRYIISYWIRKRQNVDKPVQVDSNLLSKILDDVSLPKPGEQAKLFLLWLGDNIKFPEETIDLDYLKLSSIIGSKNEDGVKYIKNYLIENGFLKGIGVNILTANRIGLTFKGWERYEELTKSDYAGNYAFMAMQYNDPQLERAFRNHFKQAVEETGFELRRLDEVLTAGLTNDNNGAYWEAGYAEGLGKPVIYLCEKNHFDNFKTHFDTNHHTTVIWVEDDMQTAMEKLKATIRATLPTTAKMTHE